MKVERYVGVEIWRLGGLEAWRLGGTSHRRPAHRGPK